MTSKPKTQKKVKAYEVREPDEGNCVIAFATNNAAARREGGAELGVEFDEVEHCQRAAWADEFAPGPVPLSATLSAGWWHGCSHCQCTFDEAGRRNDADEDEDCCEHEFEPVESKGRTYCCPACIQAEWAERRQRQAREHAAIEAAAIHFPGAENFRAYGSYDGAHEVDWVVAFNAPGVKFGVRWSVGGKTASVSQCDVEAFIAWQEQQKTQTKGTP